MRHIYRDTYTDTFWDTGFTISDLHRIRLKYSRSLVKLQEKLMNKIKFIFGFLN